MEISRSEMGMVSSDCDEYPGLIRWQCSGPKKISFSNGDDCNVKLGVVLHPEANHSSHLKLDDVLPKEHVDSLYIDFIDFDVKIPVIYWGNKSFKTPLMTCL